ncbi:serine protease inhibitor 42Dd-like [Sitodiplosis mosellana]|uniref:serine protease inhibitor 42Dd-like n=1 Tax=Sitodiplosis mosellana TaxID=263140 RepID=UPI002443CB33|nr:serine protease inhibitor 42Dd-like [Sitodiplosis mosellana]
MALHYFEANDLTRGISCFSLDLYQECAKTTSENVIISPLSVASALALLQQGSGGSTFEELRNGLHLTADKETTANQFLEYYDLLRKSAGKSILTIANHVYIKTGYQVNPNFKFTSDVNFANSDASAATINGFVTEKTQGKITNLIEPTSLNTLTRVVLVNAIYFKGDWLHKFPKDRTKKDHFYISEVDTVKVDFMHTKNKFKYSNIHALDAAALEMKYLNSNLSFLIILPKKRTGLSLEENVKNFGLNKILGLMFLCEVIVTVPKFKIEFEISLKNVLKKMGMSGMFDGADLSDLLMTAEPLEISEVLHKAFIEVNEEGSIAAAATAIFAVFGSAPAPVPPPKIFRADHPFIFFIIDTQTRTILFNGRINSPTN